MTLTDTLKVVSESCVTWATSVPILVFLDLSVLELGPMYTTDVRQKHRLMPPPYGGGGIIITVYRPDPDTRLVHSPMCLHVAHTVSDGSSTYE